MIEIDWHKSLEFNEFTDEHLNILFEMTANKRVREFIRKYGILESSPTTFIGYNGRHCNLWLALEGDLCIYTNCHHIIYPKTRYNQSSGKPVLLYSTRYCEDELRNGKECKEFLEAIQKTEIAILEKKDLKKIRVTYNETQVPMRDWAKEKLDADGDDWEWEKEGLENAIEAFALWDELDGKHIRSKLEAKRDSWRSFLQFLETQEKELEKYKINKVGDMMIIVSEELARVEKELKNRGGESK